MSSSHQKNHLTKTEVLPEKKLLLPCPECGQIKMKRVKTDCTLKDGTFVPNLEHYYCSSCHSKFYDNAAMGKIESIRQKSSEEIELTVPLPKDTHTTAMND